MPTDEQDRLDAFVNGCEAFVRERGKVTSIPGKNGTCCLQMKFETKMLTILMNVIVSTREEDRFCIIFVQETGGLVLFATGFYGLRAYGVKALLRAPCKCESMIREKYFKQ